MGTVFRATHAGVGSTVALKIINPEWSGNAVIEARFRREAQALGQIKHPNAVLVMDFGVDERGMLFLVTEFLRGESLAQRLITRKQLSLEETERIVSPLCEAVEEAHRVGVVHRDIKASNVFLERLRDGNEIVKVLDFGIAKLIETNDSEPGVLEFEDHTAPLADLDLNVTQNTEDSTLPDLMLEPPSLGLPVVFTPKSVATPFPPVEGLTLQGRVIGTITYMAPEQLTGDRVSPATDVYAIATLVFRLLAGKLPFDGVDRYIVMKKMEGSRPSLRDAGVDVPLELDRFLQTAFARSPQDRPASVLELSHAVREAAMRSKKKTTDELFIVARVVEFARALEDLALALVEAGAIDTYETVRDRILALDGPMSKLRVIAPLAERTVAPRDRDAFAASLVALEDAAKHTAKALRGLSARFDYLATLGLRLLKSAHEISRALHGSLAAIQRPATTPVHDAPELFEDPDTSGGETLEECVALLMAKDALVSEEGLERFLSHHLETAIGRLSAQTEELLVDHVLAGLWRHADELLLRDLYPAASGGFRLFPFLAKLAHRPGAETFATVGRVFKRPNPDLSHLAPAARPMLWRCLVMSPLPELRSDALSRAKSGELWTIIAFPRTPLRVERMIFDRIREDAAPEYLQVFFLCVRDAILAAARRVTSEVHGDLLEAFALISSFFALPSFHEDFVFEPLVELEAELRKTAEAIGIELGSEYEEAFGAFKDKGASSASPIDALNDVPLPIQRKLAREGHFTNYFVCHPNERVALETLRHILKREDIFTLLKMPKIHRAVLVQLVKEERFFRKEEARIALLQNPKTPAFVARKYVPFLTRAQVKQLAANKAIGTEVRHLAAQYLKKLPSSPG